MGEAWIPWDGGDCPVDRRTRVVCKMRNGKVMLEAYAERRDWQHRPLAPHFDIIAYRLARP